MQLSGRKAMAIVLVSALYGLANTPGKHQVALSWNASTTAGVKYNLYRGTSPGVCNGTPSPYASGIPQTSYLDTAGLSDGQTLYYNVSAVGIGGGESACDGEVQVQIPVLPGSPSGLAAASQ